MTADTQLLVCKACGSNSLLEWINVDMHYKIARCHSCGLGVMQNKIESKRINVDYTDYGDHITQRDDDYFAERTRLSFAKRIFFELLKLVVNPRTAKVLDFGGGAGLFAKKCMKSGYEKVYLVEPSEKFRQTAISRVGLDHDKVYKDLSGLTGLDFDLVVMLDVIEHLPIDEIDSILNDLSKNMKRGGYLIGGTPNSNSINVRISGAKDPVVAPPSHVFYFTSKSLDLQLKKHGFRKVLNFTSGLSTNSFFRNQKFSPSWIELPSDNQRWVAYLIKMLFKILALPATLLGMGYHINFLYKYSPK